MVSEDSDELVSGLFPVHRLSDLCDLDETFGRLVPTLGDQLNAARELQEVLLLRTAHRMLLEEGDDRLQEILTLPNDVSKHVLSVVVVPPIRNDVSDTEKLTELFETRDA